ncbi:MAG TPA: hypothetical protein VM509_06930 [Planctomycetota bacterium]|nr:hypothetical protein [Planctomycetota bacterium]
MLETLRADWKLLKGERPGHRFQGLHAARAQRPGRTRTSRTFILVSGGLLVLVSPLVGLIPGPGGLAVFGVGAAMLACELHFVARTLDWCEPKFRRAWSGVRSAMRRRRRQRAEE